MLVTCTLLTCMLHVAGWVSKLLPPSLAHVYVDAESGIHTLVQELPIDEIEERGW